ncbi:hypothetical protein FRZ67_01255 [Panacibacter ginsenosidivorans]|uniref:Uncharacterized protein n=1 Tax=Panacibacter ginsenosidivorans TaxID=1813871 RepID=A0A5B8V5V0_9BACT|nr:hypothetical protein [Panacibacter ginsenosidivorans]QEC65996.1 hypothetical protein FRZ67_01255 [Panacibacter ginsenosidivorans]
MKKQSAALRGLQYSVAGILLCSNIFFSCKDNTHEVVTTSCVDNKADTTGYTKELNGINHVITLQRALELTDNYARNKDSILSGAYGSSKDILPDYETFNLKAIDSLVCQEATVGFRMYLGLDENKKIRLVLAGVDANGEDILQQTRREKGSLKQRGMVTTASAPPPPATSKNDLLLESGQRQP